MSRSVSVSGRNFFPTFQPSANRTSRRSSSATVGPPIGHRSLENGRGTKANHFNVPYREPNRPLSVSRKVGGIPIIPTVGRVAARNRCAVYAGDCNGQNPK